MKKLILFLLAIIGGMLVYHWSGSLAYAFAPAVMKLAGSSYFAGESILLAGLGAGLTLTFCLALRHKGMKWILLGEQQIHKIPLQDLLAGFSGLLSGLVVSALLYPPLHSLSVVGSSLPQLLTLVLGISGFRIGYTKREEIKSFLLQRKNNERPEEGVDFEEHKILDTSVIIDGRIADICKAGFIEGTLVIPGFVLEELQHIADSSDLLKRNRGRRGLDILNKIRKELDIRVIIYEGDFEEISEVDSKLVKLAKVLQGKVITNDFNLNKVCELQGVSVLNINDLANAVKPVVLPGEEIYVQVIKDGKEHGQGVAYLDDGTMIVVESGSDFIGSTIEVMVTSVLQTSAGRMIFAKPKLLEKAL